MKNKKSLLLLLICVYFAGTLLFLGRSVYSYYDTLNKGEYFKFIVSPYDPYDPFRGRYVAIRPVYEKYGPSYYDETKVYSVFDTDGNGFVTAARNSEYKPTETYAYVENFSITRYYMNEKFAPKAEEIQRKSIGEGDAVYINVAVKKGRYVIEGMYINGIPVEKYIAGAE